MNPQNGIKCFKIDDWKGAGRFLEDSWTVLASEGRLGRCLRAISGSLWTRHGAVLGSQRAILETFWRARRSSLGCFGDRLEKSEPIPGCLGACNGGKMKHSILYVVFD